MKRTAQISRQTSETQIQVDLTIEGQGRPQISSGIGFLDHMLTLMTVHGRFDLALDAKGDIEVDDHHTVEDVGLVLGQTLGRAVGDKKGIRRYGHAVVPMDDALSQVTVDLSGRSFLVFRFPDLSAVTDRFNPMLAKEFFRALSSQGAFNLHIDMVYGENWHHMIEAAFKGLGRALRQAVSIDPALQGVLSTKGVL